MSGEAGSARDVAASIVRRLRGAGHAAWFVGGCVREILLGNEPDDYDVTTDATPDEITALFPRVVEVGRQFGVVMVVQDGIATDVATHRTEGSYTDGRRPDEVRFATAEEDVSRRDFTINALLMDPDTGEVVDHVGGRADLQERILRTVGDPRLRMSEDHLRVLRAVRFTARLALRMDEATRQACEEMAPRVVSVSAERVRDELSRMLAHPSRGHAVRLLAELGLLAHVLPEVHALSSVEHARRCSWDGNALDHVLESVERLRPGASEQAAWAALLHDCALAGGGAGAAAPDHHHAGLDEEGARIAARVGERLRMSRRDVTLVSRLVREHRLPRDAPSWSLGRVRTLLAQPHLDDLLDLVRAEGDMDEACTEAVALLEEARQRWGTVLPPPLVTGGDLLAAGVPAGAALGRILTELREEQLEERLSTREDALQRARMLASRG